MQIEGLAIQWGHPTADILQVQPCWLSSAGGCTVLHAGCLLKAIQKLRACPQLSDTSVRRAIHVLPSPNPHHTVAPCWSPAICNRENKPPSQHITTAPVPPETFLTHLPGRPQASTCNFLPRIITTSTAHTKYPHILPCRFLT